jgi:translation initiation factor 1 (eIF-1/SUI1)
MTNTELIAEFRQWPVNGMPPTWELANRLCSALERDEAELTALREDRARLVKRIEGYEVADAEIEKLLKDARSKIAPNATRKRRRLDWWKGDFNGLVCAHALLAFGAFPEHNSAAIDAARKDAP